MDTDDVYAFIFQTQFLWLEFLSKTISLIYILVVDDNIVTVAVKIKLFIVQTFLKQNLINLNFYEPY